MKIFSLIKFLAHNLMKSERFREEQFRYQSERGRELLWAINHEQERV